MRKAALPLMTLTMTLLTVHCAPAEDEATLDSAGALESADARANGAIRVALDDEGTRLTDFGFDIKQTCGKDVEPCVPPVATRLAAHPQLAKEIFGSGKMNVIRIPLRADARGVDAKGNFRPDYYGVVVDAVRNALAVNPHVRVFASRNTISDCPKDTPKCLDFDASLKGPDGVVRMDAYGRMVGQYLKWFDAQGVHVDMLGLDNEPTNNEGNLTVDRVSEAVKSLEKAYGRPHPKLMLNDGSHPDVDFLKAVDEEGKWNLVGFAGTHYQSDERATRHALLDQFATFAHDRGHKEVWDTEYHFTDNKEDDDIPGVQGEYGDAVLGVYGIFDQLDAGFSGIVWWGYKPPSENTSKAEIETAIVETIGGSTPLRTTDGDTAVSARSTLSTRAVRQGNDVIVWAINDGDVDYPAKPIALARGKANAIAVTAKPTYEQWKRVKVDGGVMARSTGEGRLVGGSAAVALPAHSITAVRIAHVP